MGMCGFCATELPPDTKRTSKRRRSSGAVGAAEEASAPARKAAKGQVNKNPSHSSDDVTTAIASSSKGAQLKPVAEKPESDLELIDDDDEEVLMLESSADKSGSDGKMNESTDGDEDDESPDAEEDEDDSLDLPDDDDSYDSQVRGDLQTNVDGAEGVTAPDKAVAVPLQGVRFFDEDEVLDAARSNMNKLLRPKRYHDDDVSEPLVRQSAGPRCFKCGLPGHVAANCPAPREEPCNLCAAFGHHQAQCPKAMCYRCQGFGHSLKDCYLPEARSDMRTCVRCGQQSCKAGGQGDWFRFMEGCNRTYSKSDLKHVRCFVCGKTGHFCCKETPEEPVETSCCLCGKIGHTGQRRDCPEPLPKVLAGEIAGEMNRSRNRGQNAANTSYDPGRAGPSPNKNTGGARSKFTSGSLNNNAVDRWDHDRYTGHSGRQEHVGTGENLHDQRAQRGAPLRVVGYGPNSRYGYRDSERAQGHAQPQAGWGNAQRSDWQQGGRQGPPGGRMHGDARQHSGAQHSASMHPPPDQLRFRQGQQAVQVPLVIQSPPQVIVHRRPPTVIAHAPPPDVQLRPSPMYDTSRAVSTHQQDWHINHGQSADGYNHGSVGQAAYRQQYGHRSDSNGRPRSHRRY